MTTNYIRADQPIVRVIVSTSKNSNIITPISGLLKQPDVLPNQIIGLRWEVRKNEDINRFYSTYWD